MNQNSENKFIKCCSLRDILYDIVIKNRELLEIEEGSTKKFASGVQETVWNIITNLQSSNSLCSKCSYFADKLNEWRNESNNESSKK
jgi:hypothetical protein